MRIVVVGGTGLIGSRLVRLLTAAGHDAVPRSRATGVDLLTGQGLPEALAGADAVVDLTKPPAFDDTSPAFFRATMGHLLAAADSAGVGHAVILSIVGADQVPGLAYYRAKVLQEDLLKAGPVPYSIVRSTQFFEFIDTVVSWTSDEDTVRLPPTLLQPVAGDEVARVVAGVVVGTPLRGTIDLAGPEVLPLDELGRITLAARGDHRTVVTDDGAGLYAAAQGRALVAGEGAVITATTYGEWLRR
ncbi:SDR family oxidoreductase [Nonomuraea bangladeshensis]|uniref:SDR family oxidoreductase n=1 Tax=Nonomuraea bangladeshensis TaxID=404385 RepID=UPI0031CFDBF5